MFWIGFISGWLASVVVAGALYWFLRRNPPNFLPW